MENYPTRNSDRTIDLTNRFSVQRPEGVTIAICTHNGAARLAPTLACAAAQAEAKISFEVLVVDNASTDGTEDAVRALWPSKLADHLRIVREPKPGVANARIRALREARYTILSFVDDDNWISSNWVAEVHRIFEGHPEVAMLHCRSVANLPGPEPDDFKIYAGWLAIGSLVEEEGVVTRRPVSFWTAGLSLRLAALCFLDDPNFKLVFTGRTGGMTLAGEDHELCLCIQLAGWQAYFTRSIFFVHDIPRRRMTAKYIYNLVENSGLARHLLDSYRASIDPRYLSGRKALFAYSWELVRRTAVYGVKRFVFHSPPDRVIPSALSYYFARGKVRGWFTTANRSSAVRTNIGIARHYTPTPASSSNKT